MMDSLFSIWPKGLFGLNATAMEVEAIPVILAPEDRKRVRDGRTTPALVSIEDERPLKRFRVDPRAAESFQPFCGVPEDVVAHCLSFLGSAEDRFALQCTSKQFHRISNSEDMLRYVQVGGNKDTGLGGIIREHDTPESAANALVPFADAGNLAAMYMLGIIKSYCHQDVEGGIRLLKQAALEGYVRASYALGVVLRDSKPEEANQYMKAAAKQEYLPALHEILPAREMKAKYGEPDAEELRRHLDPICLNRLLGRHYVRSAELRDLNTSHCWNPLCGRWAFKASMNSSNSQRMRNSQTSWNNSQRSEEPESPIYATAYTDYVEPKGRNCVEFKVSRMKMCSRCCRAKYCSKLCQVYDWRSGRHKMECQFL